MSRYSNKQLITEIRNGNEDVLDFLATKYFSHARRVIRLKGIKDSTAPELFSIVLVKAWFDVLFHKLPANIDFEAFFYSSLEDYIRELKDRKKNNSLKSDSLFSNHQKEVVAQCVFILDEQAKKLVHAHYGEKLSFEKIASRFNYSNAVIAQHEVNKAMNQLEGIVKLRLNISAN
ncbi:MAG: hypothetical protein NT126_09055 [Bacteroidetes bacterium]|nr:hypothetical protein [Bacteroidota bacterium]